MFEKLLSSIDIDIDKEIKEKLNEEANTTVLKLTVVSAGLGCLGLAFVEFFNHYDANWLRRYSSRFSCYYGINFYLFT